MDASAKIKQYVLQVKNGMFLRVRVFAIRKRIAKLRKFGTPVLANVSVILKLHAVQKNNGTKLHANVSV